MNAPATIPVWPTNAEARAASNMLVRAASYNLAPPANHSAAHAADLLGDIITGHFTDAADKANALDDLVKAATQLQRDMAGEA
jgi:hypothetical protein